MSLAEQFFCTADAPCWSSFTSQFLLHVNNLLKTIALRWRQKKRYETVASLIIKAYLISIDLTSAHISGDTIPLSQDAVVSA
jgi:hypothetical protein